MQFEMLGARLGGLLTPVNHLGFTCKTLAWASSAGNYDHHNGFV
jgi:hypothetical protein